MANKRKTNSHIQPKDAKRHRVSNDGEGEALMSGDSQPHIDPTYGQRGAFPGLHDEGDESEKLFHGPASDGLEYLRMVRFEAKGVPNLLIAPRDQDVENDLYDTSRDGYYADGAYTARLSTNVSQDAGGSEVHPQDAYYVALMERFSDTAARLRQPLKTPTLDPYTIDILQKLDVASYKTWRSTILTEIPRPTLLYGLPQEAVLKGLNVLGSLFKGTKRNDPKSWRRLGAWAWALLARCRDVSEMGSEEVSICRDLGKEAAWILRLVQAGILDEAGVRLDQAEGEEPDEEIQSAVPGAANEQASHEPNSDAIVDIGLKTILAADQSPAMTQPMASNSSGANTPDYKPATLDMIVTIVGEAYGQRDLLEARLVWGEEGN